MLQMKDPVLWPTTCESNKPYPYSVYPCDCVRVYMVLTYHLFYNMEEVDEEGNLATFVKIKRVMSGVVEIVDISTVG